jgi:hypothetical protein
LNPKAGPNLDIWSAFAIMGSLGLQGKKWPHGKKK